MAKKAKIAPVEAETTPAPAKGKSIKQQMAENAAVIQKGKAKAKEVAAPGEFELVDKDPSTPPGGQAELGLVIEPSTRPVSDIILDRLQILPGDVGVTISEELTPEEFAVVLPHYARLQTHIGFFMGDLLLHAEASFGNKYTAAVKATGLSYKTLSNYVQVCRMIPPANRRAELSFSIHSEVAIKELTPAKRNKVLEMAVKHDLSVAQLRTEVGLLKAPKPQTPVAPDVSTSGTREETIASIAAEIPREEVLDVSGVAVPVEVIPPASQSATAEPEPERALTEEETNAYEKALEEADALIDYVKADSFKRLPMLRKRQWANILRPLAAAYENLLEDIGQ